MSIFSSYLLRLSKISSILICTAFAVGCSTASSSFDREFAETMYGASELSDEEYEFRINGFFSDAQRNNIKRAHTLFFPSVRSQFTESELEAFLDDHSLLGMKSFELDKINNSDDKHITVLSGDRGTTNSIYEVINSKDIPMKIGIKHVRYGKRLWVETVYIPASAMNSETEEYEYEFSPAIPDGLALKELLSAAYQSFLETRATKKRYDVSSTPESAFRANLSFSQFKDQHPEVFRSDVEMRKITNSDNIEITSSPERQLNPAAFEVEFANINAVADTKLKMRLTYEGIKWESFVTDFKVVSED